MEEGEDEEAAKSLAISGTRDGIMVFITVLKAGYAMRAIDCNSGIAGMVEYNLPALYPETRSFDTPRWRADITVHPTRVVQARVFTQKKGTRIEI